MALSKNSDRKQISATIKTELYESLQAHSKQTDIPISKLLDRAVEQFLNNKKEPSE